MNRFFHNFWLSAAMLLTAAVSVPAQQTIIFSKPSDLSADKANSFMADPQKSGNAGDFNAPKSIFNPPTPGEFTVPPPMLTQPLDPSVKEALDKRRNWTMLTPEQILGIQTPEEIMGVKMKKDQPRLTLEEQFLLRASDDEKRGATNGRHGAAFWREETERNPFAPQNDNGLSGSRRDRSSAGNEDYFKRFLGAMGAAPAAEKQPLSEWTSAFAQPSQPKQTPDQIAAMERFRALMEPSLPPEQPTVPTRFAAAPVRAVDRDLEVLPPVNPAGHSVVPIWNNSTRPAGIKPLQSVSTPAPAKPVVRSTWEAQLPPWLRSGPQAQPNNYNGY
jgi:hypothetical protein